tara:strand:- start:456 stop:818 length:363 start_codon:yes stop_codon:yes gene_type:complete
MKNWFKQLPSNEALKKLRKNHLNPQAELLELAVKHNGYKLRCQANDAGAFRTKELEKEMNNLAQLKVDLMDARNSMHRFQTAVDICYECGFDEGALFLSMYVKLYDEFSRRGHLIPGYFD